MKDVKYRWHTIIDGQTCAKCLAMDNKLLSEATMKITHPPLHKKDKQHKADCRCYLTEEKGK